MNLTMTTPSPALPVIPTADFPAQSDRDRLQAAMANSKASSTRRCYASQWKLWPAWARDRDLEEIPAAPAAVANFLVDRADAGTSIATPPGWPELRSQPYTGTQGTQTPPTTRVSVVSWLGSPEPSPSLKSRQRR